MSRHSVARIAQKKIAARGVEPRGTNDPDAQVPGFPGAGMWKVMNAMVRLCIACRKFFFIFVVCCEQASLAAVHRYT